MKISIPLLALIGFVFYFGWKAYQNRQFLAAKVSGIAVDLAKDQINRDLQVTKNWASDLSRYWKSVWKW